MSPSFAPGQLTRTLHDGLASAGRAVATGAGLPGRIVGLVSEAEDLLARARRSVAGIDATIARAATSVDRVSHVLDTTEATVARSDGVLDSTDAVLTRTRAVLSAAEEVTRDAQTTLRTARTLTDTAQEMVAQVQPALEKVLPLLQKFADRLSPAEVDAAIALVDELPVLTRSLQTDVLPILATLDRVGPDINELLHVMDDVRRAVIGIPGFTFFKKRGAELIEEDEAHEVHPQDTDAPRPALDKGSTSTPAGGTP